jgi:tetratricopeptide (TPR) repeat protein
MSDRPPSPRVSFLFLLLAACQATEVEHERDVVSAIQHGRYDEALAEARRLAESNPRDERAQALHRDAQVAWILDRARDQVLRGSLERGLEYLEQARSLAPEHPTVESWIEKTRAQLAVHWLDAAAENSGPESMDEAERCYEKVLEYDPDNAPAIDGLSHLLLLKNYRAGLSKTYFDDGVSSFRELLLEQARRAFQVSRRYAENEPAATRAGQVERMLAEERLAQAKLLESDGLFFAARNEYRLVLLIDPGNAEGRDGLDRMDREARATRTLAEADMEIRRGQLAEAEETLAQAEALTDAQKDDLSLLQAGIEEKRLEDLYHAARTLSDDYRYPEAVATFTELLALAPDYKDAALRNATLEEFIRLAEEFYAKALEAPDDATAEELLRAIHPVIWPEYKDVVERLAAIEARKAERPAPDDGNGD